MNHKASILLLFLGSVNLTMCAAQPAAQQSMAVQTISSFPIPSNVTFAERPISLERYDMRERYDREQMSIAYSQSSSLLILKRANRYFPIIEPLLKKNGIPDDFKYLAVVESNLDTRAKSPVGAVGLWQLMPKTAQELGLEVNDEVDERYHIEKATVAACKYLKIGYIKYKDWATVAASYNGGMGRISTEKSQQQVGDFFDMLLTAETSRYVFKILAMKQFMEKPQYYGYVMQHDDFYPTISSSTETVSGSVEDWATWALQHDITYFQLKDFNIWLRDRKLSNPSKKEYQIEIPKKSDLIFNSSNFKVHNPAWLGQK